MSFPSKHPEHYVERRIQLRVEQLGRQRLQGALSEHVAGHFLVPAKPSGDDGRPDIRVHEHFSFGAEALSSVYPLRIGAVQLLRGSLEHKCQFTHRQCRHY